MRSQVGGRTLSEEKKTCLFNDTLSTAGLKRVLFIIFMYKEVTTPQLLNSENDTVSIQSI